MHGRITGPESARLHSL